MSSSRSAIRNSQASGGGIGSSSSSSKIRTSSRDPYGSKSSNGGGDVRGSYGSSRSGGNMGSARTMNRSPSPQSRGGGSDRRSHLGGGGGIPSRGSSTSFYNGGSLSRGPVGMQQRGPVTVRGQPSLSDSRGGMSDRDGGGLSRNSYDNNVGPGVGRGPPTGQMGSSSGRGGSGLSSGGQHQSRRDMSPHYSSYYRNRFGSHSPEEYQNLRISNLPESYTDDELRILLEKDFRRWGEQHVKIVRAPDFCGPGSGRLAYVNFERNGDAKASRRDSVVQLSALFDRVIKIDPAGVIRDQNGRYLEQFPTSRGGGPGGAGPGMGGQPGGMQNSGGTGAGGGGYGYGRNSYGDGGGVGGRYNNGTAGGGGRGRMGGGGYNPPSQDYRGGGGQYGGNSGAGGMATMDRGRSPTGGSRNDLQPRMDGGGYRTRSGDMSPNTGGMRGKSLSDRDYVSSSSTYDRGGAGDYRSRGMNERHYGSGGGYRGNSVEKSGSGGLSVHGYSHGFGGDRGDQSYRASGPKIHPLPVDNNCSDEQLQTEMDDDQASRTLYVGNLDRNVDVVDLFGIFKHYGAIEDLDVKRSEFHAFAFVRYSNMEMAAHAKVIESWRQIGAYRINIGFAKPLESRRLWVGGLDASTSLLMLEAEFDRFGAIEKIDWIVGDKHAYILFDSLDASVDARREMRGIELVPGSGRKLRVDYCSESPILFTPPLRTEEGSGRRGSPGYRGDGVDGDRGRGYRRSGDVGGRGDGDFNRGRRSRSSDGSRRGLASGQKRSRRRSRSFDRDDGENQSASKRPRGGSRSPSPGDRSRRLDNRYVQDNAPNGSRSGPGRAGSRENVAPTSATKLSGSSAADLASDPDLPPIMTIDNVTAHLQQFWSGTLVLKRSAYPVRFFRIRLPDARMAETYLRNSNGDAVHLSVGQRLKLDQPKRDDISRWISSPDYAFMLAVPWPTDLEPPVMTGGLATRSVKLLIKYFKEKDAAGVINVASHLDSSDSGVLYAFPACIFSRELVNTLAPCLKVLDTLPDDVLLIVIIRGGA